VNQVLFRSTHYKLTKDENEDVLELRSTYYPMPSYGNNVTTYILLKKRDKTVEIFNVRMNWNGTGRDNIAYVKLDEEKFNELANAVRSVKSQEDFDKVIEIVKDIERDVERRYEIRIEEFVRSFINIDVIQLKLKSLEDEEVKKELIEYLKQKVDDFLTDP